MKAITSGRFDPPHLGHLCNLKRIAEKFPNLRVYLLDYETRRYPVEYCVQVLLEALRGTGIKLLVNKTHFGECTEEYLKKLDFDVYCGGNLSVLKHVEGMGFGIKYFERAYDFSASQYPDPNS